MRLGGVTTEPLLMPLGARAGPADFAALYRAHLGPLLRLAHVLCGHPQQAEDAVAEAFARVFPRWRRGAVADPGAYLRRAVVNELTSRGRRRRLEVREERRRSTAGRATTGADDHLADRDVVMAALRRLPMGQRAVLALRFYEDLPEKDVAAVLGLSVGTVKSQTARGLDRLRRELPTEEER